MQDRQHLREMLERLHTELQQDAAIDPRSRELLREIAGDIEGVLERTRDDHPDSLIERLRGALDDFEETHPTLTEAVGRVVDALAKMGI